jgi:ureidoacrylate peracid hydrolase
MDSVSRTLSIDARPQPFAMQPSQTAVLVVDMQNEFASEDGALAHAGMDIDPIRHTSPQSAACWRRHAAQD